MPDTVYVESASGKVVTAEEAVVNYIRTRYDSIRADALPQKASLKILKDVCEQWRSRV
ncbi:Scr1 family TA system antitoxin-like transcriptional regulator [Sphaerisporangium siamense]|uniref:Scr1 family TA system antitoxin-like transcriptional regulator n=1 Tax=Sphaerisporangium siamense TaxID=795645 RepID=UPI0035DA5FAB